MKKLYRVMVEAVIEVVEDGETPDQWDWELVLTEGHRRKKADVRTAEVIEWGTTPRRPVPPEVKKLFANYHAMMEALYQIPIPEEWKTDDALKEVSD